LIFTLGLILFLFPMMFDDAPGRGAQNGMMAGYVADHTAYGGALQASLGIPGHRQHRETRGNN
jgi:hypothetical protein